MTKRILCILDSLDAGGAETFLMKVFRALPEEYKLDFIVSTEGGCYTKEILDLGGKIYKIPRRRKDLFGAMNGIRSIVRQNGYDCVLKLGSTSIAAFDLIAAKIGGAKRLCIRSCNAPTGMSTKSKCLNALLRPILNAVANVKIAPSMVAAEFTFGKKTAKKEVHLLHNGLDKDLFSFDENGRELIRKEFSIENKYVIGHIGRFVKQKNHRFLIEIFNEIKKQKKDAILLLVGTGELEEDTREYTRNLGLESSVIFAGVRFDIPQVLSAMDVFVFPSFHEGMPNTVIEAQATGLPCVISDAITKESNITGLVDFLSFEDTAEKWAEKAARFKNNERKDTTQDFVDNGYTISAVAKEFKELFFK